MTVLKLFMLELWRFSVIALNHAVFGRSHFTEIISHSFSNLSSVELASIPRTGSIWRYKQCPIFLPNSECYALAYQSMHMSSA